MAAQLPKGLAGPAVELHRLGNQLAQPYSIEVLESPELDVAKILASAFKELAGVPQRGPLDEAQADVVAGDRQVAEVLAPGEAVDMPGIEPLPNLGERLPDQFPEPLADSLSTDGLPPRLRSSCSAAARSWLTLPPTGLRSPEPILQLLAARS